MAWRLKSDPSFILDRFKGSIAHTKRGISSESSNSISPKITILCVHLLCSCDMASGPIGAIIPQNGQIFQDHHPQHQVQLHRVDRAPLAPNKQREHSKVLTLLAHLFRHVAS
jgi:hypothetical protein